MITLKHKLTGKIEKISITMYDQKINHNLWDIVEFKDVVILYQWLDKKKLKGQIVERSHAVSVVDAQPNDFEFENIDLNQYREHLAEQGRLQRSELKPVDYLTAKKNNPNAIGYTSKPLPFGGIYPDSRPFHDEGFAESQKKIEREQWENEQPFQETLSIADKLKKKSGYDEFIKTLPESNDEVETKKTKTRKFLDALSNPDAKTVMQWLLWIFGAILFFEKILPYFLKGK